ncbi:CPBP family intramembrane glutamic endopeptidase [Pandoraea norimbergensis]|uniref:CPBP family intramembrane glutamic endopeptidase n=1 Tax=Pandoraea norimbergensis TaxID=93219 RepID=UPI000B115AF3|nr:type II CAAX endopeptidase family protein [Pandoraea norimbergensis]
MHRLSRFLLCVALATLGFPSFTPLFAAPASGNALPDQDAMTRQVDAASLAKYREIVATLDASARARPADSALALARCQFIQNYAWSEDSHWTEQAQADLKSCRQTLKDKFSNAPEVALYLLQGVYGKEAVEQGMALLPNARQWPPQDRARLHAALANAYEAVQDKRNAGIQAVDAAELSPETPVLLIAVRHLAMTGDKRQAKRLLMDAPAPKVPWMASGRINTAHDVLPGTTARDLLVRMQEAGLKIDPYTSARAYLQAGDVASAQRALSESKPGGPETTQLRALRLSVGLAARDGRAAAAAIQSSLEHDTGNRWQLARSYAVLLMIDPGAAMRPVFATLLLTLLATGVCIVLAPGLLMFPAHYVGTVRARKGRPPAAIFERIGLRHAWYALAVFCFASWVVPALVIGQIAPPPAVLGTGTGVPPPQPTLAIAHFITLGVIALALARMVWRFGWRQWLGSGPWKARWFIWPAVLLVFAALSAWVFARHAFPTAPQTVNDFIVRSATQLGGPGLALLLIAVVVPFVEEFVFRGCLLGGLTRHMSFVAANVWQALIFASVHVDAKHFLFFFVFGLTTGWLAKKTHGLSASITMHAINNTIFVLMVLARG